MLPDIDAEDWRAAMHQRIFTVGRFGYFKLAVLHREPGPSGTELAHAGCGEIRLEFVQPAEIVVDLLFQAARQFVATAVWLHPIPEMQMVVMLAGVVENGGILAERTLDDLFEGLALEFSPLDRVVSIGHVSLVMLVVMIFERFLGHMGRKGVMRVRQVGKREGHGVMSA